MLTAAQCQTVCWGRLGRNITLLLLTNLENVTLDIAKNEKYCKKSTPSTPPPLQILQSAL